MRQTQSEPGRKAPAVLLSIGLALASPVIAGTDRSAPDGIPVGPWVLAPYVETGWERDDNVFRTDENARQAAEESDEINSATFGMDAALPFRNSLLGLNYEASQVRYNSHDFSEDTDQELGLDLVLNLNDKDGILFRERYFTGFTDIGRIENSEVVFEGEGFKQNRIDVEFFRSVNREVGYSFRLTHVNHAFTEEVENTQSFFDYDGFDGAVEYRQPLPSYKWMVAYFGFRRFDHSQFDEDTGVYGLFRKERSETAQVGIRGLLGKDQPIVLRVGWGRFQYERPDGSIDSEFEGLAYHLDWELEIGGASELGLSLDRRALPSSSDTYYINTQFGAAFQRDILRDSSFEVDFAVGRNAYGEEVGDCGGLIRDDENYRVGAEVDFRPHTRVGYQVAVEYQTRDSNCPTDINPLPEVVDIRPVLYDYEATEISIGVSFGWF